MPYIKHHRRAELAQDGEYPTNAGELNYFLTLLMLKEIDTDVLYTKARSAINTYLLLNGLSYQHLNDVFGALIASSREYKRRRGEDRWGQAMAQLFEHVYDTVAVPYEDQKIEENGDVYA